jgi:hypothetical protein
MTAFNAKTLLFASNRGGGVISGKSFAPDE